MLNLSSDLLSQFAKTTKDTPDTQKETFVYGTVTEDGGHVKLDGSDREIPLNNTVTVRKDDRVMIVIKNHTATVIGNITSPSIRSSEKIDDLDDVADKLAEFDIVIADKADVKELRAVEANVRDLTAVDAEIKGQLTAAEGNIGKLEADNVTVKGTLESHSGEITYLKTNVLTATEINSKFATIENLDATNANVNNLVATHGEFRDLTTSRLGSAEASITDLDTKKLSAEEAALTYANIDFSNIGKAAIEYFYATSGLIENVVVGDGTITGNLVGVTIKGDLIEGNTIVADKLVIQGDDGLYYKLNTDGMTTSSEQTEYNSLNGSIIMAKSITATQVSVDDLVAFDATIGGFTITEDSIYSDVKDSDGNTTRGIHLGADGQVNFGDETNFVKYYKDEDGNYKLAISAASILYALNGKQYSIADLGPLGEYVHIGTYEGEPCIELGESDSDFKLVITNTRIMFMEGSSVPAHINNQSLHITKAVIEEEIQQGDYVWKVRANGNLGLMWKGATS